MANEDQTPEKEGSCDRVDLDAPDPASQQTPTNPSAEENLSYYTIETDTSPDDDAPPLQEEESASTSITSNSVSETGHASTPITSTTLSETGPAKRKAGIALHDPAPKPKKQRASIPDTEVPVLSNGSKDYARIPAGNLLMAIAAKEGWVQKKHGGKKHEIIKYLQERDTEKGIPIVPYGDKLLPKPPVPDLEVPTNPDGIRDYWKIASASALVKLARKSGWNQSKQGRKKKDMIQFLQDIDIKNGLRVVEAGIKERKRPESKAPVGEIKVPVTPTGAYDYLKVESTNHLVKLATKSGFCQRKQGSKKLVIIKFLQEADKKKGIPIVDYGDALPGRALSVRGWDTSVETTNNATEPVDKSIAGSGDDLSLEPAAEYTLDAPPLQWKYKHGDKHLKLPLSKSKDAITPISQSTLPVLASGAKDYNKLLLGRGDGQLTKIAIDRGWRQSEGRAGKYDIIKYLQKQDLENGIPIFDYGDALPKVKAGFPKRTLKKDPPKLGVAIAEATPVDVLASWLQQQSSITSQLLLPRQPLDPSTEVALQMIIDEMNDAYFATIISRDRGRMEGSAGGILAVPEVRVRLQDVTNRGHVPRNVSNADFLCGPRALAESLNYTRRAIATENNELPTRWIPTDGVTLRNLLFEREGIPDGLGRTGVPTRQYQHWLDQRFQSLALENSSLRRTMERDLLHWDNLNIHQLEAILDLLQLVIPDYNDRTYVLGVVTPQYMNSQGRLVPAAAYVPNNQDTRAIVIWLYNDAHGLLDEADCIDPAGVYMGDVRPVGHYESFGPADDARGREIAQQWGLPPTSIQRDSSRSRPTKTPFQVVPDHWTEVEFSNDDDDNDIESVHQCNYCTTQFEGHHTEGARYNHTYAHHLEQLEGYMYIKGEIIDQEDIRELFDDIDEDEAVIGELEHQMELESASIAPSQWGIKQDRTCLPCLEKLKTCSFTRIRTFCNGEKPCHKCQETKTDCTYPEWVKHVSVEFVPASHLLGQLPPLAKMIGGYDLNLQQTEPVPEDPHLFVIVVGRRSSGGIVVQRRLLNSSAAVYEKYLNFIAITPNFRPPSTPGTRAMHLAFARQGTMALPTQLGFLMTPNSGMSFLRPFVEEFDDQHMLAHPNPHLPTEIHFLLRGHAGFGVDISAWGSFGHGFLGRIVAYDVGERQAGRPLNPPLADRIYLVVCAEPHVVTGTSAWCLQPGVDYTHHPNRYYVPGIGKVYGKFRLSSLILRANWVTQDRQNAFLNLPRPPFVATDPHWDDPVRNDVLLLALHHEWLYRANQLNNTTTIPRHWDIHTRNNGRNLV